MPFFERGGGGQNICKTQRGRTLEGLGMQWEDLMNQSWSVSTLSPSLKPLKSYAFMDFNFNVLALQTINYRSKSFKYF